MASLKAAKADIYAAQTDAADALGEMSSAWGGASARMLLIQAVIYALEMRGWTVVRAK